MFKWAVPIVVIAAIGASFYFGYEYGTDSCAQEKLAARIAKQKEEARIKEELNKLEKDQINEANAKGILEAELYETLDKNIDKVDLSKSTECVPDIVLDELRKFRQRAKGSNSKLAF